MADFAVDLTALVLPPPAPATLPPPSSSGRSSARFEDHLGQASRTPRDGAAESLRNSSDRETASESSATQATSDSEPAVSDRARDEDSQSRYSDADDAAADTSAKESGAEADASTPSAEAAAAVAAAGQAGGKSQSKRAAKRGAGDVDEAGVEAIGGKTVNTTGEALGKPGKKSRALANYPNAEINPTKESVEVSAPVTEGTGEEKTPDDKALTGDQKLATDAGV